METDSGHIVCMSFKCLNTALGLVIPNLIQQVSSKSDQSQYTLTIAQFIADDTPLQSDHQSQ